MIRQLIRGICGSEERNEMNISQIKYVLEVSNSSSIREAATKLFITQPALSSSIRELEEELQDRKVNRRREIADAIKVAREQGDLSENAEYDAAKEEQRSIEGRIAELETILKNVEIVEEEDLSFDRVNIGCLVTVQEKKSKKGQV